MRLIRYFLALLLMAYQTMALAADYDGLWKRIQQAQEKDLPKTVLSLASEIMERAKREGDSGQYLKALLLKNSCQESLTPDFLEMNIRNLESMAVDDSTKELDRALVHSILSRCYAQYLTDNYYRIRNLTSLDGEPPSKLSGYSPLMLSELVASHARSSLESEDLLRSTTDAGYVPLVEQGRRSQYFRHDFYHLLTQEAIESLERISYIREASSLAGDLAREIRDARLEYYQNTGNKEASLLLLVERLLMDGSKGFDEDFPCLQHLVSQYEGSQVLCEVYIEMAQRLQSEERYTQALEMVEKGLRDCGRYYRAPELENIRQSILSQDLSVSFPDLVYPGDGLPLRIGYRNLDKVLVTVYRSAFKTFQQNYDETLVARSRQAQILSRQITLTPETSRKNLPVQDLPYAYNDTVADLSLMLEPGVYVLEVAPQGVKVASRTPSVQRRLLYVSRLGLMTMNTQDAGLEVAVVDRKTGAPVPSAHLNIKARNQNQVQTLDLDSRGMVRLIRETGNHTMWASLAGDEAMRPQNVYMPSSVKSISRAQTSVALLTDRSLYRPGQKVHYKGVAYRSEKMEAEVVEGSSFVIRLYDANHQEVESQEVTTGEMGSFSGSFTLPEGGLAGQYSIGCDNPGASRTFHVEAFTRPTFEILFDDIRGAYVVGDDVTVSGKVLTYSGDPLKDGFMSYRITASSSFYPFRGVGTEPLKADTLRLDASGCFSMKVHLPDSRTLVDVDVWDQDGSAQSASLTIHASSSPYHLENPLSGLVLGPLKTSYRFGLRNSQGTEVDETVRFRLCRLDRTLAFGAYAKVMPEVLLEGTLESNKEVLLEEFRALASGQYLISFSDSKGRELQEDRFYLLSKDDGRLECNYDLFAMALSPGFDTGSPARVLLGSSLEKAMVFVSEYAEDAYLGTRLLSLDDELQNLEIPYKPEYGQGLTLVLTLVRDGAVHTEQVRLERKLSPKPIQVEWMSFRDFTVPGSKESWSIRLTEEDGTPVDAEVAALMYDAALDRIFMSPQSLAFRPHLSLRSGSWRWNGAGSTYLGFSFPIRWKQVPAWSLDRLYQPQTFYPVASYGGMLYKSAPRVMMSKQVANSAIMLDMDEEVATMESSAAMSLEAPSETETQEEEALLEDDGDVTIRQDFSSFALFLPHLRTDGKGLVSFDFIAPSQISRWNFKAYVHTKDMRTKQIDTILVTRKDFSVEASMPRFAYQGDRIEIPSTLANQTDHDLQGTLTVTLFDVLTGKVLKEVRQRFSLARSERRAMTSEMRMPESGNLVGVRMVARSGALSDGEQHVVALLEPRQRIVDTKPIILRNPGLYSFSLDSIAHLGGLRGLDVEYTSNTSWYALQALASLRTPGGSSALDKASVLYSDYLLYALLSTSPVVYEYLRNYTLQTQGTGGALTERLEALPEVRMLLKDETPWVRDSQAGKAEMARALDLDALYVDLRNALDRLSRLQDGGGWSWYEGMRANEYITTEIALMLSRVRTMTIGFQDGGSGRLLRMNRELDQMMEKAMSFLDEAVLRDYERQMRLGADRRRKSLTGTELKWLYLDVMGSRRLPESMRKVYDHLVDLAERSVKDAPLQLKARLAVVLEGVGRKAPAKACLATIHEYLLEDATGVHLDWITARLSEADRLDLHVQIMEALQAEGGQERLLEGMRTWLLLEKKTQAWDTPQGTVRAVGQLLGSGEALEAAQQKPDQVVLRARKGADILHFDGLDAMGYVHEHIDGGLASSVRELRIEKETTQVSWGAVYWDRTVNVDEIEDSSQDKDIWIERRYFVRRQAQDGTQRLEPLKAGDELSVRDVVISRLVLHVARAMDFISLKDPMGACLEPVDQISSYRWTDGMGYYKEIRDASVQFFLDSIAKGDHVIENAYRVTKAGSFTVGAPWVQSVFDPSQTYHGHGEMLKVSAAR